MSLEYFDSFKTLTKMQIECSLTNDGKIKLDRKPKTSYETLGYGSLLQSVKENTFPKKPYDLRIFEEIQRDHFLDNAEYLSLLFSNAQHIINKFSEGRVVGLSQSPA